MFVESKFVDFFFLFLVVFFGLLIILFFLKLDKVNLDILLVVEYIFFIELNVFVLFFVKFVLLDI